MSNKHYRTPAKTLAAEQLADTDTERCLGKVKAFLEKVLDRVLTALDESAALPKDDNQRLYPQHEWFERRSRQLATIAKLGITACRTMLQALKLTGADTSQVRELMDRTVAALSEKAQPTPQLATG